MRNNHLAETKSFLFFHPEISFEEDMAVVNKKLLAAKV